MQGPAAAGVTVQWGWGRGRSRTDEAGEAVGAMGPEGSGRKCGFYQRWQGSHYRVLSSEVT